MQRAIVDDNEEAAIELVKTGIGDVNSNIVVCYLSFVFGIVN